MTRFLNSDKFFFILLTLTGVILSVFLRYELMWDFLNYHYYNGFAFVNDRLGYDIAPASLNTYFNPLLDTLTFLAVNAFNDRPNLYYALTGLPFGLLLFVCFKINCLFIKNKILTFIALIIAATGFATFFQIGTSTNEIPIALIVMTALYFLIKAIFVQFSLPAFLGAAFLLGSSAALKSTAAVYCVSSGLAVIAFYKNFNKPFKHISLFTLCGALGFLVFNGFWMVKLYTLFQNPLFPFMNTIFKSPFFDDVNLSFSALKEKSWLQILMLPLIMTNYNKDGVLLDNTAFCDIRFAAGFILLFCAIPSYKTIIKDRPFAFLILWCGLSYVLWLSLFSVIRYLVPVEMLLPIFFIKAAVKIAPKQPHIFKEALIYSFFLIFIGATLTTPFLSNSWGTRKGHDKVFEIPDLNLPENTILLTRKSQNSAIAAKLAQKKPLRILHQEIVSMAEQKHKNFTSRGEFLHQMQQILKENPSTPVMLLLSSPPFPLPQPEGTKCRLFSELSLKTTPAEKIQNVTLLDLHILSFSHLLCVPIQLYDSVFENAL